MSSYKVITNFFYNFIFTIHLLDKFSINFLKINKLLVQTLS
jgi:hypothetical protein